MAAGRLTNDGPFVLDLRGPTNNVRRRYGPFPKLFNYFEICLTDSCPDDTVIGALVRTRGICA